MNNEYKGQMVDLKSKFYCASSEFVESFLAGKKILLCTLQGNILLFSVLKPSSLSFLSFFISFFLFCFLSFFLSLKINNLFIYLFIFLYIYLFFGGSLLITEKI